MIKAAFCAWAAALATMPLPAFADWTCEMTPFPCASDCEPLTVAFEIDPNQFVAPQNPNDPPRRQVTQVQYGDAYFVAEAIMMPGGVEGFFEDAGPLGRRLMIVRADGTAQLSVDPGAQSFRGTCED